MKKFIISTAILLTLSGCSNDVKSTLGIRKEAPDEFTVISYPPLSVPPEFNLEQPSSETIDNTVPYRANGYTAEESRLLNKMSSQTPKSETKALIDKEHIAKKDKYEKKGVITKTIDNLNGRNEEPIIDPESEKERIDKNLKEQKPINEGYIEDKESKSTLERIFGS